jgi:hypothetical protein
MLDQQTQLELRKKDTNKSVHDVYTRMAKSPCIHLVEESTNISLHATGMEKLVV